MLFHCWRLVTFLAGARTVTLSHPIPTSPRGHVLDYSTRPPTTIANPLHLWLNSLWIMMCRKQEQSKQNIPHLEQFTCSCAQHL